MSDFSFYDPPIEVAAGPERLAALTGRLRAYGMRPFPVSSPPDFFAPDPLLVDTASAGPEMIRRLARARMIGSTRQIILLGEAPDRVCAPQGTLHLGKESALAILKSRLSALARRERREREASLRRQSALSLGASLPQIDVDAIPSLLYLAGTSPRFLSLQHGLSERGVQVTAALSQRTASQYLTRQNFTAALIDACETNASDPLSSQINGREEAIRLPLIVLSLQSGTFTAGQMAILNQASEIVDASDTDEAVLDAIETHCRRLHANTPLLPPPGLMLRLTDIVSGLFSRAFLEAHLPRQTGLAARQADPFSLLTLRLDQPGPPDHARQKQAGATILSQIRDTDCAALYQPGVFVISLPSTDYRGAMRLAGRIDSAFSLKGPLDEVCLSWRVAERRSHHTAQGLLNEALTGPFTRAGLAA